MIDMTLILIGITALFGIFIALRSIFSLKICALCASVSLTWITLLFLFYLGYEINPVFVGILMGGSVVGVMYFLEQKLPEKYQLFKLPFFLTLVSLSYFVIEQTIDIGVIVTFLVLWLLMVFIHISHNIKSFRVLGRKMIECCKNW
tara:strand:- start:151 stop:588 length:438 start_codon:yes stop_codon:yes gene_type:complete